MEATNPMQLMIGSSMFVYVLTYGTLLIKLFLIVFAVAMIRRFVEAFERMATAMERRHGNQ